MDALLPLRRMPPVPLLDETAPDPATVGDKFDVDRALRGAAAPVATLLRRMRAERLKRGALRHETALREVGDRALADQWQALSRAAQAERGAQPARRLAILREIACRQTGLFPHPVQVMAAAALSDRTGVEMATGEGKTLVTMMAAALQAAEGWPVHVVTANDYLASRDREAATPLFDALGLSHAVIEPDSSPEVRRAAYRADIVYGSSKEIAFDHLRDRISHGTETGLGLKLAEAGGRSAPPIQRGLWSAIVDEADSVLIDEARTPLIISAPAPEGEGLAGLAVQAIAMAGAFAESDYALAPGTERPVALTDVGIVRLEDMTDALGGVWASARRGRELAERALYALHVLQRDIHYILREEKVEIVDENTGRVMPDRTWSDGLHQMVEVKEGLAPSPDRLTIGRLTFQRFFRRYRRLSGLSGTLHEARRELVETYGLAVMPVPTHRPSARRQAAVQIFAAAGGKWSAVAKAAKGHRAAGRPVLIGARSVAGAEAASAALEASGLEHRVLSARQDKAEADVLETAGESGAITVATNMAGRGADIRLSDEARRAGGLVVMLCERHEARRIDRQLIGRCARQGDPGLVETYLAADDGILGKVPPSRPTLSDFDAAQRALEALHARQRADLNRLEDNLDDMTAFAGGLE